MICPKCKHGLPDNFFYKARIRKVVNCPNCSTQLRVDLKEFGRVMWLPFVVAAFFIFISIPTFSAADLQQSYRTEAIVVEVVTIILISLCLFTYMRMKHSFKAVQED
ncbi:MAG: hypothetical protein ACR2PR_10640 [Pseudohongiellaceae bacterium]